MFKIVSLIILTAQLSQSSLFDCDGSYIDRFPSRSLTNKAKFGEFPWTVALFRKDSLAPHCAGSIIDEFTILTTAFCVKKISNPYELIIRAGIWDLNKTQIEDNQMQQRVAAEITAHPHYTSPEIIENDIAIIRVNHPFKFEKHIQKICLDNGALKVHEKGCFATGWGSESNENQGQFSQYLKKVSMDQVAKDSCEKDLRIALEKENFVLSENFICAGGNANDLCVGDTGAPLICPVESSTSEKKFVLVGLSSYGSAKCFTTPGVYTKVSRYSRWIEEEFTPSASDKIA